MNTDFATVWERIESTAGETFETKTGKPFVYEIDGNAVTPDRTDYRLTKTEFEKAFNLLPLDGPGEINDLVRGPAYIWAILHDPRIRKGEW